MRFCEESRRVRAVVVVRADDAGVAERGLAVAGVVCYRRRLRSERLVEVRRGGQHAWSRGREHAASVTLLCRFDSRKKFAGPFSYAELI